MKLHISSRDELPTHHVMKFNSQGLAYSSPHHKMIRQSTEVDKTRATEIEAILRRMGSPFAETSD